MSKVTEITDTELMRPFESMQQIDHTASVCVCLWMMDCGKVSLEPSMSIWPLCAMVE